MQSHKSLTLMNLYPYKKVITGIMQGKMSLGSSLLHCRATRLINAGYDFLSMKRLGASLPPPPPPWMGCQSIAGLFSKDSLTVGKYQFTYLGRERQYEVNRLVKGSNTKGGGDHASTTNPLIWFAEGKFHAVTTTLPHSHGCHDKHPLKDSAS